MHWTEGLGCRVSGLGFLLGLMHWTEGLGIMVSGLGFMLGLMHWTEGDEVSHVAAVKLFSGESTHGMRTGMSAAASE
jgi:hypothetical protein